MWCLPICHHNFSHPYQDAVACVLSGTGFPILGKLSPLSLSSFLQYFSLCPRTPVFTCYWIVPIGLEQSDFYHVFLLTFLLLALVQFLCLPSWQSNGKSYLCALSSILAPIFLKPTLFRFFIVHQSCLLRLSVASKLLAHLSVALNIAAHSHLLGSPSTPSLQPHWNDSHFSLPLL